MHSLWFKARYVAPILDGSKRDTIRAKRPRFEPGEIVAASVGPVRPFALLRIDHVEMVCVADLPPERRTEVLALYPLAETCYRVHFTPLPTDSAPARDPLPDRRTRMFE